MLAAIDLFAGVGGMSVGARHAGLEVKFAVERDKFAAQAYKLNNPHCEIFCQDIRHLTPDIIKQIPKSREGTVVFGGPPCQGFSYSNTRTRNPENKENWLFEEFFRVVKIWQPDFVVFENVQGIINTAKGFFLEIILSKFSDLSYAPKYGLLNAADYGVPQNRNRFFLIASRINQQVSLPNLKLTRPNTVRDAIADLPKLANGANVSWLPYGRTPPSRYAKLLRTKSLGCTSHLVTKNNKIVLRRYSFVPPGGNWENVPDSMMANYRDRTRCHTGIYRRLAYDEPSVVIGNYRKNMLIHPSEDRGLSVREAARLQSFPDFYRFAGTIGFQQQQVCNAVPPLLAAAVFNCLTQRNNLTLRNIPLDYTDEGGHINGDQ